MIFLQGVDNARCFPFTHSGILTCYNYIFSMWSLCFPAPLLPQEKIRSCNLS